MDWRHIAEILAAGAQVYSELKSPMRVGEKSYRHGSFYRSRHELVFVISSAARRIATISCWVNSVAIARMCGVIRVPVLLAKKATYY